MARYWGPLALSKNFVMVFPQAKVCWDNINSGKLAFAKTTGENSYSREGPVQLFMKSIIDRIVEKPDGSKFDYDYSKQAYEFGTAYDWDEFMMSVPGSDLKLEGLCETTTLENGEHGSGCFANMYDTEGNKTRLSEEEMYAVFA